MVNVSQVESSVHQRQSRAGACLQDELNAQILVTRDVLCSELSSLVNIGLEVSILSKVLADCCPASNFCSVPHETFNMQPTPFQQQKMEKYEIRKTTYNNTWKTDLMGATCANPLCKLLILIFFR